MPGALHSVRSVSSFDLNQDEHLQQSKRSKRKQRRLGLALEDQYAWIENGQEDAPTCGGCYIMETATRGVPF